MEKAKANRTNCNKEDDSLGILSMENLKVFGETSVNASNASSNNQSRISDRLNQERHKAFETLKKFDNSSKSHKNKQHYNNASNKENHQQGGSTSVFDQTPSVTDQSHFVHYRRPTSINISDLVTDTSITLEKSIFAKPTPVATKQQQRDQQLSFEPAEITGRSTLNKLPKQQQQLKSKVVYADHVSVADILASSFAPKARDLSETLRSGGGHDSTMSSMMDAPAGVRRAFSTTSSSMMSYNGLHSLPRTADMSKMSQSSELSLMGGDGFSFSSASAAAGNDRSTFNDDNFAPGEMMMNKLILDEIAWADEFAAIPAATLSKQARATAMKADIMTSNPFDSPRITNSMLADGNHSVGTFFNMRSENIWDMVKTKSPDKFRTPIALVDLCTDDETTQSSFDGSVHATSTRGGGSASNAKSVAVDPEITPKPDNKTYTKLATPTPSQASSVHKEQHSRGSITKPQEKHESKDSGHDWENSFLLSMSAIDRALCNLNIETDNSEAGVLQQVLNKAKQTKSPQLQEMPPPLPPPPRNSDPKGRANDCLSTIADILSENKENLNPEMLRNATLSDTMEFTESLLNSTDMKQAQRSSNNSTLQRSPLSPLNLLHPHGQLMINGEGNEADEDEWPSTPVKGYNRRQRRTKSPRDGQNSPREPDKSESENRSERKTPMQNGGGGVCLRPLLHPDGQLTINGEGNEADEDEWPSTPPHLRRQRRTKSPRDGRNSPREPEKSESENRSEKKTPMQNAGGGGSLRHHQHSRPKSLCSTRIDGAASECDLGISPTISRNASPNITVTAPINGSSGGGLSLRNHTLTNSSPIPYQTASPMSRSPMSSPSVSGGYRSPQLDSTTNSERRYLSAGGGGVGGVAHKANSSPVPSDSGNSNYGVPPTRTYSGNSQRSTTTANGRSISRCSNSSEFSHRDGKAIPLKVTQLQLSWGSTKLRTTANKTMQVKNIAHKRLVVRLMVQGPGFQLLNSMSNTLTLQSQECRSIVVTFCPTVTGIAIGALCFYSPVGTTTMNTPFLEIPLYGYGGHAAIVPQNMQKGPVGAPYLPLGDVCELTQPLQRSFRILNRGPLLGFAYVYIDSMGLMMPRLSDAFEVHPQCMLIPAGKTVSVTVTFRPRREDIKKIVKKIQQVLTLANMRIICGDEANRQRMRHLSSRMSAAERSKISSNTLDMLLREFPREVQRDKFEAFKEEPDIIMDLIASMRIQEIALTINRDGLDDTVQSTSMYYPDADDTVLFRTIYAASPVPSIQHLEPVDEMLETSMRECNGSSEQNEDERAVSSSSRRDDSWSVHPSILEFDFRANSKQQSYGRVSLLIRNSYKSRQYFEVTCNRKQLLAMTPSEGYVAADGGQVLIEVRPINEEKLMHECAMQPDISILVHMENERITVPVKIYQ